MADNIAITPGSGANVATDDVSGVHYQRVKLDGGGDGVAVPLELNQADFDTGAGTDNQTMVGIALPGNGGAVVGGTQANPLKVDFAGRLSSAIDSIDAAKRSQGPAVAAGSWATDMSAEISMLGYNAVAVTVKTGATTVGYYIEIHGAPSTGGDFGLIHDMVGMGGVANGRPTPMALSTQNDLLGNSVTRTYVFRVASPFIKIKRGYSTEGTTSVVVVPCHL